jgi:hypothetical protein
MRVKFAWAGEGGGCTPTPFYHIYNHHKVAVYAPAEWADTLTLFHLLQRYVLCGMHLEVEVMNEHRRLSVLLEVLKSIEYNR